MVNKKNFNGTNVVLRNSNINNPTTAMPRVVKIELERNLTGNFY